MESDMLSRQGKATSWSRRIVVVDGRREEQARSLVRPRTTDGPSVTDDASRTLLCSAVRGSDSGHTKDQIYGGRDQS